jgi:isopenicillin N synthase-like dioxygenase
VPLDLQRRVMNCSRRFFNLPLEEKVKIDKSRKFTQLPQTWLIW